MKKIIITTNHPAIYISQICRDLEKSFVVVPIYVRRGDSNKQWKNVDIYPGIYYDQLNILRFIKEIRKSDLVILGGWINWYCLITILLAPFLRTKVCMMSDHPAYDSVKNKWFSLKKYLFNRLNYIMCATQSTMDFYHRNYGISRDQLKLFPYSFDTETDMTEIERTNKQREIELNKPNSKIRLFIASRFIERKGYSVVIDSFRKLKDIGMLDKFQITVAGSGEKKEFYEMQLKQISQDINCVGWIETEQYREFMLETDIYLHPSLFEPSGIPPLDAMYRKKLVIASDGVESVRLEITNGLDGYLYPANDSNALFNILRSIKKEDIYQMGAKGFAALNRYYPSNIYELNIQSCISK